MIDYIISPTVVSLPIILFYFLPFHVCLSINLISSCCILLLSSGKQLSLRSMSPYVVCSGSVDTYDTGTWMNMWIAID